MNAPLRQYVVTYYQLYAATGQKPITLETSATCPEEVMIPEGISRVRVQELSADGEPGEAIWLLIGDAYTLESWRESGREAGNLAERLGDDGILFFDENGRDSIVCVQGGRWLALSPENVKRPGSKVHEITM